jgi:YHS domain-containing protein
VEIPAAKGKISGEAEYSQYIIEMIRKLVVILVLLTLLMLLFSCAGDDSVSRSRLGETDNPAILGYDPVAYFTDGRASAGSPDFTYEYQGIVWQFSSEENRRLFIAEPETYMPYFGEYCANGLSDEHVIGANPEHWLIDDGRLFLFYSARGRGTWEGGDLPREFGEAVDYYRQALGSEPGPGDPAGYR